MAINEIKVNTSKLKTDSNTVNSYITSMERQLSDIKTSINQLNSMWTGVTKEAFVSAVQNDLTAADTIIRNLKKFQKNESEAEKKYQQCENKAINLVNALKIE